MRRYLFVAAAACVSLPLLAFALTRQDGRGDAATPDWENPRVFAVGEEPAHATLTPYPDERAALAAGSSPSPFVRSLDGAWKFHWARRPEERPADFRPPARGVRGLGSTDVGAPRGPRGLKFRPARD